MLNCADTILITVNEEGVLSLAETNVVLMSASHADLNRLTTEIEIQINQVRSQIGTFFLFLDG